MCNSPKIGKTKQNKTNEQFLPPFMEIQTIQSQYRRKTELVEKFSPSEFTLNFPRNLSIISKVFLYSN